MEINATIVIHKSMARYRSAIKKSRRFANRVAPYLATSSQMPTTSLNVERYSLICVASYSGHSEKQKTQISLSN